MSPVNRRRLLSFLASLPKKRRAEQFLMNEDLTLKITYAGADAQPVVCDTVAVCKDIHLHFQIHQVTE